MDTDPQITARLVEAFQAERARSNLSKTELARRVGVSRGAVSQWLNGSSTNLRPQHLFAVADALSIEARWLATGKGPKEKRAITSADTALLQDLKQLSETQRATLKMLVRQIAEDRGQYSA